MSKSRAPAGGKSRTSRGSASARGKSRRRPTTGVSIGVGTLQLDQVPDELLTLNDWNPSLRRPSCGFAEETSLQYYTHFHHRHEKTSGLETALEAEAIPRRVPLAGNLRRAVQRRTRVPAEAARGEWPRNISAERIVLSDNSESEEPLHGDSVDLPELLSDYDSVGVDNDRDDAGDDGGHDAGTSGCDNDKKAAAATTLPIAATAVATTTAASAMATSLVIAVAAPALPAVTTTIAAEVAKPSVATADAAPAAATAIAAEATKHPVATAVAAPAPAATTAMAAAATSYPVAAPAMTTTMAAEATTLQVATAASALATSSAIAAAATTTEAATTTLPAAAAALAMATPAATVKATGTVVAAVFRADFCTNRITSGFVLYRKFHTRFDRRLGQMRVLYRRIIPIIFFFYSDTDRTLVVIYTFSAFILKIMFLGFVENPVPR